MVASRARTFGVEIVLPVRGREVPLEDVDEPVGDRVGLGGERFPLVEDDVERHPEVGERGAGLEEPAVGDADAAVARQLDHAEPTGALHELGCHRARREMGQHLDGIEDDRVRVAEQRVELGLHADHRVEAAALLPLLEQVGDAGEGVAFGLETRDQLQAAEVRLVVPTGAALEPGRCKQTLRSVEAHGRGRHVRPPGEIVQTELLCHLAPLVGRASK